MSALRADEEFESDKPETEATLDTNALSAVAPAARATQIRHAEFLEALQRAVEATRNVTNGLSPPEDDHQRSALVQEDVRDEAPPVAPIDEQAAASHEPATPSILERAVMPISEHGAHEQSAPL